MMRLIIPSNLLQSLICISSDHIVQQYKVSDRFNVYKTWIGMGNLMWWMKMVQTLWPYLSDGTDKYPNLSNGHHAHVVQLEHQFKAKNKTFTKQSTFTDYFDDGINRGSQLRYNWTCTHWWLGVVCIWTIKLLL